MYQKIQEIVMEEFQNAERRILKRIYEEVEGITLPNRPLNDDIIQKEKTPAQDAKKSLPENPNYHLALESYRQGKTHSAIARELGVSIATVKNYYNTLVIRGFLEAGKEELSKREQEVADCIRNKNMSLGETAKKLGLTVTNVTNRRNSALRKDPEFRKWYEEKSSKKRIEKDQI